MGKRWGQKGYLVFSESLHLLDENKPIQGIPNQNILCQTLGVIFVGFNIHTGSSFKGVLGPG